MSYIAVGQAAKILGVNKRTLQRWDESGRFSPDREEVSRVRVYEEVEVRLLKTLLDHEKKYEGNLRKLREVMGRLNIYGRGRYLGEKEIQLLGEEERLMKEHKELFREFVNFSPELKRLYKSFYIGRWT